MPHETHYPILSELGINATEALVYELLLELGPKAAQSLLKPSALGRGNLYNALTALKKKGLVFERGGKKTVYEAAPPDALAKLVNAERSRVEQISKSFEQILPILASEYNLSTGKPVIQIFEGIAGFEQALWDSLTAKGEILTYFDPAAVTGEIAKINKRYVAKRRELKIPKRIILPNNQAAHDYLSQMSGSFTEVILATDFVSGFQTAMELYDNKITFLTLTPEKIISVIIEDPHIAALQRAQFEYIWKKEHYAAASTRSSTGTSDSNAA